MKSNIDNDEGNIGIITEEREQENEKRRMNKVVDKLEQRISTLERVLQSHAKCIGEMRDNLEDMPDEVLVKTWGNE
tara:strand:- start:209 stop:436 length:228 start_codon:yes stop_codon:yes gene_type:complete